MAGREDVRLHQIGAALEDAESTRAFYEEVLGAKFLGHFDQPGLLFFDCGGVRILFEKGNSPAPIYLWVDDIDEEYERLRGLGVKFIEPPSLIFADEAGQFVPAGHEEWMAFFPDPSGNTLALATQRLPSSA